MRVLGIDPGTTVMGYGLIQRDGSRLCHLASGAIKARGKTPAQRLHSLHVELSERMDALAPDTVAVEDVFFHRNVKSAIRLGQGQAIALLVAASADLSITTYSPTKVKLATVGNGRATKEQVQAMVCRILSLDPPPTPLDITDALAVAICHAHRVRRR